MTTSQPRAVPPFDVLLPALVDLAEAAGRAIEASRQRGLDVRAKADGSPVGRADTEAHAVIIAGLGQLAPGVPIVSEEGEWPDASERAGWSAWWLVDPLDGTKEFLAGACDYTVNIALISQGVPVAGVVHASGRAVTYYGARGIGSFRQRDGLTARLAARPPLPGRPLTLVESRSHASPDMDAFLAPYRVGARVAIGSSLKFCLVADGTADVYVRLGCTMEWDVAAGDAVFRWASDGGAPLDSPLTYGKADFRNGPFVIGFLPPPASVLWLTGLSGAGKTTIAQALVDRLEAAGVAVELIDGDAMRQVFPGTGFSRVERDAHVRRVGYLASRLEAHGVVVVASLISPYRESRAFVRGLCRTFVEIHVATDLAECERRDPKGLYRKARAGEIAQFTGLDDPYEAPETPELVVDTATEPAKAAADRILAWVRSPSRLGAAGRNGQS
ncbi:MAG: 3'(2'),5'-bisphosphate nucleotidase CysQ [Acidobacteria bacterium]|nr:3'(2'),5'-bisphosphate nucleotidase CysQ [Acidobacteriota bacterium]